MRPLLVLLVILLFPSLSSAADIYITQNTSGSGTGVGCSNAHSASWFNTASNWGGGATQIGAGSTVHLCGTITTQLITWGSGSAGNVITVKWETNARLSLPFCDDYNGCFGLGASSFIVLDGGRNGIIEATANGTHLANQHSGKGITLSNQNVEIKNLTIRNLYVRAAGDATMGLDHVPSVYLRGNYSNFSFHDNIVHDCSGGPNFVVETTTSNITLFNNNIYNVNAGIVMGGQGVYTTSNITIYNNHIHDTANWDDPSNTYHHNGVMLFGPPVLCCAGVTTFSGVKIYNNLFDGDMGDHATSLGIYLAEAKLPDGVFFNNVTAQSNNPASAGGLWVIGPYISNVSMYNNTFACISDGAQPAAIAMGATNGPGSSYSLKNNVFINCAAFITNNEPASSYAANGLDNNIYVRASSATWKIQSTFYGTLTGWQAGSGQDANAKYTSGSPGLDSAFHPQSGSIVVGAGTNQTSLRIAPLNYDKAGVLRSPIGPSDVGAYSYTGSGPAPVAPIGLQVQ